MGQPCCQTWKSFAVGLMIWVIDQCTGQDIQVTEKGLWSSSFDINWHLLFFFFNFTCLLPLQFQKTINKCVQKNIYCQRTAQQFQNDSFENAMPIHKLEFKDNSIFLASCFIIMMSKNNMIWYEYISLQF